MALDLQRYGHWFRIETAPADGTRVDLWVERYYLIDHSKPDVEYKGMRIPDCIWKHDHDTNFKGWHSYGGSYLEEGWSVTHWMPIPDGP